MKNRKMLSGIVLVALATGGVWLTRSWAATPLPPGAVALTIDGGHETDPRDGGRPVVLIAAALGVPDGVFRDAFSRVRPARNGPPSGERLHDNKRVLLDALGKYGVTNDRLDEVSDYYRYPPGRVGLWKNKPATGYATVVNGRVTNVKITEPGSGYTTPPTITVEGHADVKLTAELAFGKDLKTNGSVRRIAIGDASTTGPATRP